MMSRNVLPLIIHRSLLITVSKIIKATIVSFRETIAAFCSYVLRATRVCLTLVNAVTFGTSGQTLR
jgi:hypothetical protein